MMSHNDLMETLNCITALQDATHKTMGLNAYSNYNGSGQSVHSERPKFYGVLAFLGAIRFN